VAFFSLSLWVGIATFPGDLGFYLIKGGEKKKPNEGVLLREDKRREK